MMKALETANLRLRPLDTTDLDDVHLLHNDLEIKALTIGWELPVTREACRLWIEGRTHATDDATWAATACDGEFIGIVRVMDIDRMSRRGEVGLYFGARSRGQGVGRDALALVSDWGFKFLGLHRLEARILSTNTTALALFESAGFAREGVLRDREYRLGHYHDVVLLGLLAPE